MSSMRCPNCGLNNFDTDSFCRRCGTNLSEPQVASSPGLQPPAGNMAVQYGSPAPQVQWYPQEKKSSSSKIIFWIVTAVVVLVCMSVVGGLLIWKKYTHIPWEEYRSSTGRYSILMPGHPREIRQSLPSPAGDVEVYTALAERPGLWACVLTHTEYPAAVVDFPADKILEAGIQSTVTKGQTKIVSKQKIKLGKYEGIEFDMISADSSLPAGWHMIGRFYWVPPRAYVMMVMGRQSSPLLKDRDIFFNSFSIN